MFTGIIEQVGHIDSVEQQTDLLRLQVRTRFTGLALGESIAVDGACLTVTAIDGDRFTCELSSETLARTVAGSYVPRVAVNLERALRLGDRLGGHWVTGHVDAVGRVHTLSRRGDFIALRIDGVRSENQIYLIEKGSIAVNGVSLTLNQVHPGGFEVMLIPHTADNTNLAGLRDGSQVNLEYDWMTKVIVMAARERRDAWEGKRQ
jgi:riboflavin synthase